MGFICHLCQFNFKYKQSLQKHLREERCCSVLLSDLEQLNEKIHDFNQINKELEIKCTDLTYKYNDVKKVFSDLEIKYHKIEINYDEIQLQNQNLIQKQSILQEEYTKLKSEYQDLEKKYKDLLVNSQVSPRIESSSQFISGGTQNQMMNFNIKIEINPITNLKLDYIEPEIMKTLVEKYDSCNNKNPERLNILLSDYIKNVIYNKDYPENHAVKYVKKKPPTYNCIIKDENGNTIQVIKQLKDTCELLSDPMLNNLKIKLTEFLKKYKKDEEFDYEMYEDTIQQLRKELNKKTVKKALSSVLQNDILNDIEMKFDISMNEIKI
jgi:hypothetical protein